MSATSRSAGKINFHVSGIGQETCQVARVCPRPGERLLLPYYRDYGFVLAVGMTPRELMLSAFAKAEDPNSGGRQMPGHFGSKRLRIVTGSSPVTTQLPHAVGIALAAKMQKKDFVSFVTFGEGSSNQGIFTRVATLRAFTNFLSLSCARITNTPFRCRFINRLAGR